MPSSDALLAKSRAAEGQGNREAALRLAQAAIVADPAHASNYTALADLYMRNHDADSASFYYAEALSIDPEDAAASRGLALADSESQAAAVQGSLDNNQNDH